MLDIFTIILAVIGTVAVALLIYVARQPSEFRIERTYEIGAPADKIFPLINDLKQFNMWNPFAKADPASAITCSGPTDGVGAAYEWSGRRSGAGRMQIATSIPSSKVTANLDFLKPFAASNIAEFTLVARGGSTAVIWAMTGRRPFSHKCIGTIFNMDKMVGGEFAKGLAELKAMAERKG
ncbi:MAG: SRPBCC family protein [Hyphomicrobiaceae bacterium]